MRLRYKLLLINAAVAGIAALVLWQAYAAARTVENEYKRLRRENLPSVASLNEMLVAASGIVAATHELGLLALLPRDDVSAPNVKAANTGETVELRQAVFRFEAASMDYAFLMKGLIANGAGYAHELADAGRDLVRASKLFLAELATADPIVILKARERLEAAEKALLDDVAEVLDHEDRKLIKGKQQVAGAIEAAGRLAAIAGLVTLFTLTGAGWAVAWAITRPINRLTEATARLAAGEPVAIAAPRSRDEIGRLVGAFRKMTDDLASSRAEAQHLALHDALTGLPNRVLLAERLSQALAHRRRQGGSLAVICLDLDRFKEVNDTLGHGAGDSLLRQVADRLLACVRETDTVARLGGDEFAIVQVAPQQPDDAEALCRRLLAAIEAPFVIDGHDLTVGLSLGVALAPADGDEQMTLLKHADIALYRAKAEGRGTFRFFTDAMNRQLQARKALERDLRRAFVEEELTLAYQPQVELTTGRVVGAEALLRWRHPERGEVSPGVFIPVAEETGLIVPIGEWVLRTACAQARAWPDLKIAVNLSPAQFRQPGLVGTVAQILAETGLDSSRLELEITEGVLLTDTEEALVAMLALKELGVRIAMDDFGTGYSSLSYLRRYPFDKIKIDRSFIADLGHSAEAAAIVRSVVGLGCGLGMVTIAEGVEDRAQAELLRAEGCDEVQGYFFGRPMTHQELGGLLDRADAIPAEVRAA